MSRPPCILWRVYTNVYKATGITREVKKRIDTSQPFIHAGLLVIGKREGKKRKP